MRTRQDVVDAMVAWNAKHYESLGRDYTTRYPPSVPELYDCLNVPHIGKTVAKDADGMWYCENIGATVRLYASKSPNNPNKLHRLFITCPACLRDVDAGHFQQHKCSLPKTTKEQ